MVLVCLPSDALLQHLLLGFLLPWVWGISLRLLQQSAAIAPYLGRGVSPQLLEQDLLELTPKKDVLFIIGDWNAKVGSQEIPGVTGKYGLGIQNEAGRVCFLREHTGHSKHPLPTTQAKTLHMDITRWSTPKSD